MRIVRIGVLMILVFAVGRAAAFEFSKAGYWEAKGSPRVVRSMNPGWEFSLDGFKTTKAVNLPHSIDEGEIGLNASGCVNRQQKAWYRKRFAWRRSQAKAFLHFEAVMGKSRVAVNGREAAVHYGGFLPIHVDVTDLLKDGENLVEVECDNSNDPDYPPGKAQDVLDWTYFGGIYRDVWLVETGSAYVADTDRGGVYVTSALEADGSWTVTADVTLGGAAGATFELFYDGERVVSPFRPKNPALWTPDEPNLHRLDVRVSSGGVETDAVALRFGIRDFSISREGLSLNGKPWRKLIGVNRHQDFAYIGMALPNSLHWRDAKKYRDAGFTIVRNAHYPQDPAFMDACDALGLFVIVNPPGWQFWNDKNPVFEQRVYDDILKMVRRDRSRASLFMWEPILNETRYPGDFAHNTRALVKRETRAPNYCACDKRAGGSAEYDILYTKNDEKPWFTREWGDYPDDWCAQNSPSRVPIEWGEGPMLVQAEHYTDNDYGVCCGAIARGPADWFGGCMWHGADHSRGYHPDNFFGGVLSYDRRKKYSWYAVKASLTKEPFVYLANALAPCSPQTITIFSNCAYRATWLGREVKNGDRLDRARLKKMNYALVHAANGGTEKVNKEDLDFVITLANGMSITNRHAGRFCKIGLALDTEGMTPLGDGSDLVVCRASLQDARGVVRRYQTEDIVFSAEGPVQIVGENPQRSRFGESSVLLRPLAPGRITVTASLRRSIAAGDGRKVDLVFDGWNGSRVPNLSTLAFTAASAASPAIAGAVKPEPVLGPAAVRRKASSTSLKEVEAQQKEFVQ